MCFFLGDTKTLFLLGLGDLGIVEDLDLDLLDLPLLTLRLEERPLLGVVASGSEYCSMCSAAMGTIIMAMVDTLAIPHDKLLT